VADSTELKHSIYPTSAEGMLYYARSFSVRVKQLEREAAYLWLRECGTSLTSIHAYSASRRCRSTLLTRIRNPFFFFFFFFSCVWVSLGVLDPVGYPSFQRFRDDVDRKEDQKKGGKKINVTVCRLHRVQCTIEQDTKAQRGVEV